VNDASVKCPFCGDLFALGSTAHACPGAPNAPVVAGPASDDFTEAGR
jgi:hypothetical protein